MYFRSIQFLRFFAALYVALFHVYYWWNVQHDAFTGLFNNGYGGIDLFFVISGFVIMQSAATFKPGLTSSLLFLKRRFVRIYPIYWIFVLFFTATGMVNVSGKTLFQLLQAILLLPGQQSIIIIAWTLTYEIFFYFLIALTILSNYSKYLLNAIFLLAVVAQIIGLLGALGYQWHFKMLGFYNEFVLEFFLGTVVWRFFKKIPFGLAVVLVVAGTALFLVPLKINAMHVIAFGIPSAMLLTGFTALEFQQKVQIPEFLVLLGNASYSLYIIHVPLLYTAFSRLDMKYATNRWVILLLVAALLGLAVLIYLKIERPLLLYLNSFLRKPGYETQNKKG